MDDDLMMENPLIPDINVQAAANLAAAQFRNPEAELAAVKKSEATGMPVGVLRELDNSELKDRPDPSSLHSGTQKFFADDPSNAFALRDKVKEAN
ncbi:MAG: hypothetical protein IJU05_01655, partial [Schwartzia sp.]|nr:hypothetical protein [Schwartzia sp. (in: firmicutes)]